MSEELYIEPKGEKDLGSFLTPVQEPERQNAKGKKSWKNSGKKRKPDQQRTSSNDTRNYLGTQQWIVDNGNARRKSDKESCNVVIV